MKKRFLWIGGAIVLAAAVGGMVTRGHGKKPMAVQTAKAERRKIVQKVSATGKIKPKTQVEISADVSAKIVRIAVVEGQHVDQGTLLVELAKERYQAAVESATASVSSAQANAALVRENKNRTEKEFSRSSELVKNGLESQSVFEAKRAEYMVETARLKSAEDQVAQA